MTLIPARQCVRCGDWFAPCPNPNDAGRKAAGLLVPNEGPVCYPCLDKVTTSP